MSSTHGAGRLVCRSAAAVMMALVLSLITTRATPAAAGEVPTRTTVTKYTYNADAALTSFTVQPEGGPAVTTYVTWDDFVPDANDATTGTVMRGNGTMRGFGPSPGAAQFEFDARDRLVAYHGDGADETYGYLADGNMSSSSAGGDERRFYYDDSNNARVTNIHQGGQDLWSAYLPGVRYLSDGSEQVLVQPRKDLACTYDADAKTIQSYAYDMFGSQPQAPLQSTYDLHDNPFQYSGEYRDPMWGGVYLRARWYDPDLPIFLSRDPVHHLNRYGYGGGNPVMNVDPSGMNFWHSLGAGLRAANRFMNKGVGGHFARIFLAPFMNVLQLAAYPKAFWESIKHDRDGIDIFLAAGVVTEGLSVGLEGYGLSAFVRNLSLRTRFATRLVVDSGLAIGQAVAAGADRGFHHFDWNAFSQNIELSAGGLLYSRGVVGEGFHPYALKSEDVVRMMQDAGDHKFLIFRERTQGYRWYAPTSPLTERAKISFYHERIIAVSRDYSMLNEVVVDENDVGFRNVRSRGIFGGVPGSQDIETFLRSRSSRFQYVGEVDVRTTAFFPRRFQGANPLNFPNEDDLRVPNGTQGRAKYGLLRNNCHSHAQALLRALGF